MSKLCFCLNFSLAKREKILLLTTDCWLTLFSICFCKWIQGSTLGKYLWYGGKLIQFAANFVHIIISVHLSHDNLYFVQNIRGICKYNGILLPVCSCWICFSCWFALEKHSQELVSIDISIEAIFNICCLHYQGCQIIKLK